MNNWTRRNVLQLGLSGAALMGSTAFSGCSWNKNIKGANDRINLGVAGIRGKGHHHTNLFHELPGVRVAALCDADKQILAKRKQEFTDRGEQVRDYVDIRAMLDDKDIDGIVIASPNHWHSLMGIWAAQAGKDVYVEKPVSHNVWEGAQLVKASQKYNVVMQAGTQNRSDSAVHQAFNYIHEGHIGKITLARGLCYKRRKSIGKVAGPQPIPDYIDYNLWTGPAPLTPLMRERLHYDWHWVWPTGNGDIGNQGIHEMDMCRWVLGEKGLPDRVLSFGGRYGYTDDGNTPNTQICLYDYQTAPLLFEVRGLPVNDKIEAMDNYRGVRIGIVIHCEQGYFAGGAGGGWIYDNNGNKIKQFSSSGGNKHHLNFIEAMRSRKSEDLNGKIQEAHISTALCHLGNISYRLGQHVSFETAEKSVQNSKWLTEALSRTQTHLNKNQVDLNGGIVQGAFLDMTESRFVAEKPYDTGFWANEFLRDNQRPPFKVPEKV